LQAGFVILPKQKPAEVPFIVVEEPFDIDDEPDEF
jgi:hypothetical protein